MGIGSGGNCDRRTQGCQGVECDPPAAGGLEVGICGVGFPVVETSLRDLGLCQGKTDCEEQERNKGNHFFHIKMHYSVRELLHEVTSSQIYNFSGT